MNAPGGSFGTNVQAVGYVPLSDEDLAATRERWASRTTGAA